MKNILLQYKGENSVTAIWDRRIYMGKREAVQSSWSKTLLHITKPKAPLSDLPVELQGPTQHLYYCIWTKKSTFNLLHRSLVKISLDFFSFWSVWYFWHSCFSHGPYLCVLITNTHIYIWAATCGNVLFAPRKEIRGVLPETIVAIAVILGFLSSFRRKKKENLE